jgi:hypothetical protein
VLPANDEAHYKTLARDLKGRLTASSSSDSRGTECEGWPPKASSAEALLIRTLLAEDASLRPSTHLALTMPWLSAACFEGDAGAAGCSGGGEGCDQSQSEGLGGGGPEAGRRGRVSLCQLADPLSGDALALELQQVEAAKTAEHLKALLQRALVPPCLPPPD